MAQMALHLYQIAFMLAIIKVMIWRINIPLQIESSVNRKLRHGLLLRLNIMVLFPTNIFVSFLITHGSMQKKSSLSLASFVLVRVFTNNVIGIRRYVGTISF